MSYRRFVRAVRPAESLAGRARAVLLPHVLLPAALCIAALGAAPPAAAATLAYEWGFVELGSRAVFLVGHPGTGGEPWVTDGTAEGTFLLAELRADWLGTILTPFAEHAGRLYLLASPNLRQHPEEYTDLWVTDGTRAGTRRLPLPETSIQLFVALGAAGPDEPVLFVGPRAIGDPVVDFGLGLWSTDGTPEGTALLLALDGDVPTHAVRLGDRFVFATAELGRPAVLWSTDGSAAGTVRRDLGVEWVGGLAELRGEALFFAGAAGLELWAADAAGSAPRPLAGLGPPETAPEVGVHGLAAGAFLAVREPTAADHEIWLSDGTPAGTAVLDVPVRWISPVHGEVVDGRLWFGATSDAGAEQLWVSDGTPGGTRRLADVEPFGFDSGFLPFDGGVVFIARTSDGTALPWFSDGTAAGTISLGDVCPAPCDAFARSLLVWEGSVYATAFDGIGFSVWRFDRGLPPVRLTDRAVEPREELGIAGGRLVFTDAEGLLWSSDGTPAGTRPVVDLNLLPPDLPPCVPDAATLCLGGGRFTVRATLWRIGVESFATRARSFEGSDRAGWFWSFAPDNPEVVVKVLDGTPVNGRWWVFVSSLTGFTVELTVRDAVSGWTAVYQTAEGSAAGVIDLDAFPGEYDARLFR